MTVWKWVLPFVWGLHALDASAGWLDEVGLELRFDDNLTRAQLDRDIKSDTALVVSAAAGTGYQLTDNGRLSLTLTLSGSAYQRYEGLNNLNAGLELAYRWKFGLGPYVPELRLSGSATRLDYRDAPRDGWLYLGEIAIAKRLSDRSGIRMSYRVEQRESDTVADRLRPAIAADVFDLTSQNLSFGGDYAIHPEYVFSAAYTIRDGDIVSTTRRNLPVFLASSAIAADPVFGSGRFAYKMKAITRSLSLGVSRVVGGQASFTLGYEYLDSRAKGGIDYEANLVRATYLYQF
ncbi:hypothetical protein [Aromatoleum diolicum]|uniref:DUF2490 domain-containing protein n=1 Tax=Aromatoleum diolicum TaxID=75796 RepID=A0ABX1QGG8_9RHOO|nr:hypothetical protein [Aromatoleum diolicum]NMG76602.1 hypothetical protein [Aromatoleum diolicum]